MNGPWIMIFTMVPNANYVANHGANTVSEEIYQFNHVKLKLMKKLPKLHELLAIEGSLETQANTTRQELTNAFEKKRHLYNSQIKTFYPSADGAEPVQEEVSSIQTTVEKEFVWISGFLAKSYDASLQVAEANTKARGSVTLSNGTVLAENVPATALLELEKRINELLTLVKAAPTLDPAKGCKP